MPNKPKFEALGRLHLLLDIATRNGSPMASLSEFYSDAPGTPHSLWAMLEEGSKAHNNKVALTAMHQPPDHLAHFRAPSFQPSKQTCLQWTFADLHHATFLLAAGLRAQGVRRGASLVTLLENRVECVLLLWVSAVLQLTLAPLDPRLLDAGREEQLREYMRRLRPDVVVVQHPEGAECVDGALQANGIQSAVKVALEASDKQDWKDFARLGPREGAELDCDDPALAQDSALDQDGDRIAIILFTSGTSSGNPKGCPRTVRNLLASTVGAFGVPDLTNRAIIHTPNSGAICQAFFLMYGSTGRHVIMPSQTFSPAKTLDAIEQHGAEVVVVIPVMSRMFEKELATQERNVSALRQIAVGGDMVTADAKEKFEKLFPKAQVVVGHGMTEGQSFIGWRGHGAPSTYPQHHHILGLGYPQRGALIRICDERGKVLPRGEAGELHLGGPCVIENYLENAQPEAFYRDEQGHWMLTGDRAFMNESGVIFIIGRNKDIIKRVGLTLSPAVAESVLNRMDGVEVSHPARLQSRRH